MVQLSDAFKCRLLFFPFLRGDEGGGAGEGQGAGGERGATHDGGRQYVLYTVQCIQSRTYTIIIKY
jgi:hypothetical protein